MSWAVQSTVDEPVELLCAFIAHHLSLGAAEVHLYLDRQNDEVMDIFGPHPEIQITVCDNAYWSNTPTRQRPISQADRQVTNLRRAYSKSRHDWLLFCDADEFLFIDKYFNSVDDLLKIFKPDVLFHTFSPAERFYMAGDPLLTIFDGRYRCRSAKLMDAGKSIYGDDWDFFSRGLLQDGPGKSILRVGAGLDVNIHAPKSKNGTVTGLAEEIEALRRSYILHYDGLTPLHWALKLARWYGSMIDLIGDNKELIRKRRTAGRNRQAEVLHLNRSNPQALRDMTHLQFLDLSQASKLDEIGGTVLVEQEIAREAMRMFPALDLDFTQDSFNRRLLRLHGSFIADSGFKFWGPAQ